MNEGLFTRYTALPAWTALFDHLSDTACLSLAGMTEGEKPFFAAALAHAAKRPVLLVSPTELIAKRQAQDIGRLGITAAVLPSRDVQFSRAASSRESSWQRLQVLQDAIHGRLQVLCISAEAMLDRCPNATRFQQAVIALQEGGRIAPNALIDQLLRMGYERVPMVEGRGQCAMRGAIVDIYPPTEIDALRLEFFDDEVDSIRRFDAISQRSIERIKAVQITPASECILGEPETAALRYEHAIREHINADTIQLVQPQGVDSLDTFFDEIDSAEAAAEMAATALLDAAEKPETPSRIKHHLDDAQTIRAGYPIRTAPMWLNVLCTDTETAASYLSHPIVLVDQPDQVQSRAKAKHKAFLTEWQEAALRGDSFPQQQNLLLPYADLLTALKCHAVLLLSDLSRGLGQFQPTDALEFTSDPIMPYNSRLEPLAKDIAAWQERGCAVVLLTGGEARGRRLLRALEQQNVSSSYLETADQPLTAGDVVLLPISVHKGFRNIAAGLCVVSDSDLYGSAYQRTHKHHTAGEHIASFTDLHTGDYVVHDIHGIGIYDGVVQLQTEGVTRDYLLIRYLGNDKLYVPTDQFDRVQKFIGADQGAPKLNRLGSGAWEKQKNKVKAGLKELAFDLAALYAKRQQENGFAFSRDLPWQREFEELFPYELTEDQQKSVEQIFADMESNRNMDRLLCGDVGYGKTEVALRAAFKAMLDGKQVAILAPTTILVQQHYNTMKKRFAGFPVTCEMLSRFRTPKEQREIVDKLKEGKIDIIVGTHRLLAKDVKFKDLGLLIIDEEHRFGVSHKEQIKHMKTKVDVLTLSATPIPRTLHMSLTGIRDMSLLETPPEERLPVKTYVTPYDDSIIANAIRHEMARGGQVYFLYNRVRSIEQMYSRLQALVPDARIAVAHGQMRENALEDVMLDFYAGAYDVLLCSTIIESGLDVPEANTLIVFDADHFGLSQLYQLRGRVGRSSRQAYAYLTIRRDKLLSEAAEKRLTAIREFTEFGAGYRIAMRDLEIRGAGDVLGPQQSGQLSAVGYDMYVKLIEQAVHEVQGIKDTPELDTRVELALDAFLPEDLVQDERLRIEVYKRIAMIEDDVTKLDIEAELIDRFGDIPQPVENLMLVARLRAVTRRLGINHLFLRADGIHMRLEPKYLPDPMALYTAAGEADKRIQFSRHMPPEMIIKQPNLEPDEALALAIKVLTDVYRRIDDTAPVTQV
ncbi:MAG TPA: transcription-repair coupling factor [Candidatus Limiplasma sp.]|nr:transcription-repair coupling factor [Candidatus Limiplasma sp.]